MSKFPLDLSKFKRTATGDGETTLQHPDGHRITVLHSALDKTKLASLNALPMLTQESKLPDQRMKDGGTAGQDIDYDKLIPQEQARNAVDNAPYGAPPTSPPTSIQIDTSSPGSVPQTPPTNTDGLTGDAAVKKDQQDDAATGEANGVPASAQAASPIDDTENPEDGPAQPSEVPSDSSGTQPQTSPQPASPAHIGQAMGKDPVKNQQTILNEMSQVQQEMAAQSIKPETYSQVFADKSTLGKISTIFGLLLGGAGAGLTHQQNPLTAMWDKQISNDLEAQKANFGNKATLFSSLQHQFGDVESASAMARLYMDRLAFQGLIDQGKNLPPAQKAQYDAGLGMLSQFLDTRSASASQQIAMKQALVKSLQDQPGGSESIYQQQQNMLRRGNAEQQKLADENDKHHVPGFPGQSSVPIPQEVRDRIGALNQYDQKAKEYVNFAKQHAMNWANLSPADRLKISNQGAAMGANLQSLYRNKIKGGVYKTGEQEFIEQIIPDQPASWSANFKAIPKVMQTINDNRADLANTAQSYGLRLPGGGQQAPNQQQPQPQQQIKTVNGVKYMRGPDGQAIQVQ